MIPWQILKTLDQIGERMTGDRSGETISAANRASDDPVRILLFCAIDLELLQSGAPVGGGLVSIRVDIRHALSLIEAQI